MGNILEVHADGELVLEVDESGAVTVNDPEFHERPGLHRLAVENRIPARIESAACGGVTLETLLGCGGALCLADVDDVIVADSAYRPGMAAVTVLVPAVMANQLRRNIARLGMADGIERRGDGVRLFLFIADQVIRQGEPEPKAYPLHAAALVDDPDAFLMQPRVRTAIENLVSGDVPSVTLVLPQLFGVRRLSEIPPKALFLWAVDNGVHDLLPGCYRTAMEDDDDGADA